MQFAWTDLRNATDEHLEGLLDAAIHARVASVVVTPDMELPELPPTISRVVYRDHLPSVESHDTSGGINLVRVASTADFDNVANYARAHAEDDLGVFVYVTDQASLDLACLASQTFSYCVVQFKDPTKIPLEIVIAAADKSPGRLVCVAESMEEAEIVKGVLEKGSDGIMMAPSSPDDVFELARILGAPSPRLELSTLTVRSIEHTGMGDRVCVDTCTHFDKDEGILVGSYSHGYILCVSETHPLPYMPTRPFRVNAGALHSYTFNADNRTNYLSELRAGSQALAVGTDGRTRRVTVGRVKLESRPLLTIHAEASDGTEVSLTLQDDWHVRVLGPGPTVHNVTELRPGDELLGYLATDKRHVGWPVGEFCVEQ